MKYKVFVPCDYVIGYLRTGHFEGVVEANSIEEVKTNLMRGSVWRNLDFVVDDCRAEDYEVNFDEIEIEEYE